MSKIFSDEVKGENILQRMWEQCEREQFCDVVLIAGTDEIQIPAHRSVLCAASDYFETMFTSSFEESTSREVKMLGADGEILKMLVKYCYMRHIEIREDNVEKLLEAADLLRFGFVINACCEFLTDQLHPNNCFSLTLLAERHNSESLSKMAKDYCLKHFVDFYKTDDFLQLNAKQLCQLLASDDLCVPCEEEVFKSVVTWIEYNRLEREQNQEDLFKLVRMPLMNLPFLNEHVRPLYSTFACLQLYTESKEWHLNATSKSTKPRKYFNHFMMALTRTRRVMHIMYHCPRRLKWMKWPKNFVYSTDFTVAVMDENLYIAGDMTEENCENTVSCFNFGTMKLKEISPLNKCRVSVTLAALKGFLYALGGYDRDYSSAVEKWDPSNDTWSTVTSMSARRQYPGVTVFNGKLYAVGGRSNNGYLRSAECYDPEKNLWESITPMHEGRNFPGLAVANGMLYVIGGSGNKTIERYSPDSDEWTVLCNLNQEIYGGLCTIYDDKVMLFYSDRVEEYNFMSNDCKVNSSINGLENAYRTFLYKGGLLIDKFVEK